MGCCAACDEPLREVVEVWPAGPLEGEPRRFGQPYPQMRLHLLLVDGSQMVVSVCPGCQDVHLPTLWKRLYAAHVRERKNWREFGAKAFTPDQTEQAYKFSEKHWNNIPVGVLYREPMYAPT